MVCVLLFAKGKDITVSVDRGAGGIDQVFCMIVPAGFQNAEKADDIRLDIGFRMVDGIPDACLGCKVDDQLRMVLCKESRECFRVCDVCFDECKAVVLQPAEPRFLQGRVIVIVQIVDADDPDLRFLLHQTVRQSSADKASSAGNQYGFSFQSGFSHSAGLPSLSVLTID